MLTRINWRRSSASSVLLFHKTGMYTYDLFTRNECTKYNIYANKAERRALSYVHEGEIEKIKVNFFTSLCNPKLTVLLLFFLSLAHPFYDLHVILIALGLVAFRKNFSFGTHNCHYFGHILSLKIINIGAEKMTKIFSNILR